MMAYRDVSEFVRRMEMGPELPPAAREMGVEIPEVSPKTSHEGVRVRDLELSEEERRALSGAFVLHVLGVEYPNTGVNNAA